VEVTVDDSGNWPTTLISLKQDRAYRRSLPLRYSGHKNSLDSQSGNQELDNH